MPNENTEEEVVVTPEEETVEEAEVEAEEEIAEEAEEEAEEETVDYDGSLKERKTNREHNKANAERRIADKSTTPDETADVAEIVRKELEKDRETEKASYVSDLIIEELSKIENLSERELVEDLYTHTIQKSGTGRKDVVKDIGMARILANQPRVSKENSEMKVAIKNRQGMSNDSQGTSEDKPQHTTTKWTKEQLADFEKRGISPEDVEETQRRLANQ